VESEEGEEERGKGETGKGRKAALWLSFLALVMLLGAGLVLSFLYPQARRTFVFKGAGGEVFESRLLARAPTREEDLRRYIDESLLGPASVEDEPLFVRGTKLSSFMYRDGVVYADFSRDASIPPQLFEDRKASTGTGDSFSFLRADVLRNFPYVKAVRFFVGGQRVL
jgi:hypothetical protein